MHHSNQNMKETTASTTARAIATTNITARTSDFFVLNCIFWTWIVGGHLSDADFDAVSVAPDVFAPVIEAKPRPDKKHYRNEERYENTHKSKERQFIAGILGRRVNKAAKNPEGQRNTCQEHQCP